MKAITINHLQQMKQSGDKFAVVTAYDASFAKMMHDAEIECILVGDSLGMVMQGHPSTVPVTMDDMIYHTQCVTRGNQSSLIICDMPYMSYANSEQTIRNAARLMQAGAQMVKLEGGEWLCDSIQLLTERGIPVCAHLGLLPQSVDAIGGFKVQGRDETQAKQIISDAQKLQQAGARLLVLECVPAHLAKTISELLQIPVIGIGAGPDTDAQVLVLQDLLGMNADYFQPKFVKNFMQEQNSLLGALKAFAKDVKTGHFPAEEHCFR